MARFIECRTSQGVVYQVNVDQITYLQRGARDEYTRIHFAGMESIGVQEAPQQIMGKVDYVFRFRGWNRLGASINLVLRIAQAILRRAGTYSWRGNSVFSGHKSLWHLQ